jgi:hypothetical protein
MGVLVEAGGGYRAKLFATHPKATKQIRVDTRGRAKAPLCAQKILQMGF